jgi:ligand-binding sensor domain-containing protein
LKVRALILFLLFSPIFLNAQTGTVPVGSWQEHLPYGNVVDVTASENYIYAATPFSIFTVDRTDGAIGRQSRVTGLSETGITAIRFNPAANQLFIAYSNSNIDLLTTRGIRNIPDLKREMIQGDKTIYHILPDGNRYYLSTGIGIVVIDGEKGETSDAWFIGANGTRVRSYMVAKTDTAFYAATQEGLKAAPVNANLADFRNWQDRSPGTGPCKGVALVNNQVIAWQQDTLYRLGATGWTAIFHDGPIVSIETQGSELAVCQSTVTGGATRVLFLRPDGSIARTVQGSSVLSFPQKAVKAGTDIWIGDLYGGLSKWSSTNTVTHFLPNSPLGIASGELLVHDGTLYATAGSVNDAWNYRYNRDGIYRYRNGQWTNFNQYVFPQLDSLMDFITIAIDPQDGSAWAGSYGGGLLHIKDDKVSIHKFNTALQPAIGDPTSYRVSGLAFDAEGNLWVANFGAQEYLHVRKKDGSWKSFSAPFTIGENAVAQVLVDDFDNKWIIAPKGNGLIAFNHGSSIEAAGDDRWRIFRGAAGNGNLPAGEVLTIAKDKSGFIWVGTMDGIGVIQCADMFYSSSCEAVLPIVMGGNFANYLFKGEEVRGIAVDGADRKWVATRNGVWLISPDGDKLLAHFTEANSPLLSNDVRRVAIDGHTGTVYFATNKGICSYRGTATEGAEKTKDLLVFPNPVPPGYNGDIAIRGLSANAFVKITELNGRLVYQLRANGGQAVWNGKDYKGNVAASGVYLVLVTDETQQDRAAGKIVITR